MILVLLLVAAAAAPHFFFTLPLELHFTGEMTRFYGITFWSPALLAGFSLFRNVPLTDENETSPATVGAVSVGVILYIALLYFIFYNFHRDIDVRPWAEIVKVSAFMGTVFVGHTLFLQGYVQTTLWQDRPWWERVVLVVALQLTIAGAFYFSTAADKVHLYILATVIPTAILAVAREKGLSTLRCLPFALVMGIAFVWFQQSLLF